MSAASRAKRIDPSLDILVLEKSPFISYSICGVPYFVEGLVSEVDRLIRFTPETFWKERQIRARTGYEVLEIVPARRLLIGRDLQTGQDESVPYDSLLISTGYTPIIPPLDGLDGPNVYTLSNLDDGLNLRQLVEKRPPGRAVVVGGGYIGLSMTEALRHLGWQVAVVEKNSAVYPSLDADMSALVEEELKRNSVGIHLSNPVRGLRRDADGTLRGVALEHGSLDCDLTLVDIGIQPNVELARSAGIPLGATGAIAVNERMETGTPGIFAAGNCAETFHLVSRRPVISALGTAASKQGRIAGENMAGRRGVFSGILGTAVSGVFDLTVAQSGLSSETAVEAGFRPGVTRVSVPSRAGYFPGIRPVTLKLIFDQPSRRVLGAQIIGDALVAKRIDVVAAVLTAGMRLEDVAQLDLAYAPPFAPLWDPLLVAANVALREQ